MLEAKKQENEKSKNGKEQYWGILSQINVLAFQHIQRTY